jgi:hypothetical protein
MNAAEIKRVETGADQLPFECEHFGARSRCRRRGGDQDGWNRQN